MSILLIDGDLMPILRPLLITLILGAATQLNAHNKHDIFRAIENNDITVVRELLNQGADVNITADKYEGFFFESWSCSKPLTFASQLGNIDIIELLLAHDADIEGATNDGDTALITASRYRRLDVIEILLKHGANINAQNKQGKTALMIAVTTASEYFVSVLLEHKANLTLRDKNNWTVLTYAQETLSKLELEAHYAYYDNEWNDNGYELWKCGAARSIIKLLKAHGATE